MVEESDADFKISAFDIVSLYPWANFNGPYPLGHPDIITPKNHTVLWTSPEDIRTDDGETVKGLLKVRITPPRGLYLPVIPYRSPEGISNFIFNFAFIRF
jgi:hypothetical protein